MNGDGMRRPLVARRGRRPALIGHAALFATLSFAMGAAGAAGDAGRGKEIYTKNCAQCHGAEGGGDGPAAKRVLPRPRVFKDNATYKFRTTPSDALPTDQDLFNIITRGIPGSSMPSFDTLVEQERWDLVAFIKSLAEEFADPQELAAAKPLPELANPPERPKPSAESTEKGRQLYEKNQCFKCHGTNGRGNGPSWPELKDSWNDTPILPANLTSPETYRGGAEPFDIFRTFSTGLRGTPMPEYQSAIPDAAERWHLVNYVVSLHAPRATDPGAKIVVSRVDALPESDDDAAWAAATPARIRTLPNVIERPRLFWQSVEFITVQALYTSNEIALRIRWDDRTNSKGTNVDQKYEDADGSIYRGTPHPDQLAIQLPPRFDGKTRPYVLFGDNKRPANLWWWRADQNSFSEIDAKGYGAFTRQPDGSQGLKGRVTFDDGRYTMVVRRALSTEQTKNDAQFVSGAFLPILFHVWDGDRGEVGTRRALTTWYWLYLEAETPRNAFVLPPIAFLVTLGLLLGLVQRTRKRAGTSGNGAAQAVPVPGETRAEGPAADRPGGQDAGR